MCPKNGSLVRVVSGDSGSGTIMAVAVIGLSVATFSLTQTIAQNLLADARLVATTEAAALAADDALRGLTTGFPCEIAKEIAAENVAILDECRIVGFEAFVKLHTQSMGIVLNASARAGPSS